ncbi:hypothetical protein D3C78_844880 [compost metagenome]
MAGQRLGVADVHQAHHQLQRIDEARAGRLAALDAERQDRRWFAAGIALGQFMLGVVGQPCIFHPRHLLVGLQVAGDLQRVLGVALHAQGQGFQALQDQEGVERRQRCACVAQRHHAAATDEGGGAEGFGVGDAVIGRVGGVEQGEAFLVVGPWELAGVDDDAADAGAVAADVLGQRVHHDVGAVLERPAEDRRGHGVVDDQRHAVAVRGVGQGLQVDDVAGRVADGFAEHRLGALVDQRFQCGDVVMGCEARLDAEARQGVRQQVVSPAIQLGHRDDVVAGLGDGLDRIGDRRHARGHRQRPDATFQRSDAFLQHGVGRVHDPRIDVAGHLQVEQVGAVLGVVERVGGGLVDRHGHRPGGRIGAVAGVDGEGFQFHATLLRMGWQAGSMGMRRYPVNVAGQ